MITFINCKTGGVSVIALRTWSKMNDILPDMTPSTLLLDVCVSHKKDKIKEGTASIQKALTVHHSRAPRFTSALIGAGIVTLSEHLSSSQVFSGVRVTRALVVCVCFVDSCLSFLSFFFWTLCCLFFDLRILITPLVSRYLQNLLMMGSVLLIFLLFWVVLCICALLVSVLCLVSPVLLVSLDCPIIHCHVGFL